MKRILLFILLFTLFSCQKKSQKSKINTQEKTVVEDEPVIINLERSDSIIFDPNTTQKLSEKEVNSIFTKRLKKQLGIEYPIYQAYAHKDSLGLQYLLLTDHYIQGKDKNDRTYNAIKAFQLYAKDKEFKKRSTLKDEIDKDWEVAISFWNEYSELADFDKDGYNDLILTYGTLGPDGYADGRIKIMIYHNRTRATIRHQNSEYGGRLTKISSKFYMLPKSIQKAAIAKMKLLEQNHATFPKGWEKKMSEKATRIE